MEDFLEFDEKKKTINPLILDDFSVEDLEKYASELRNEILMVEKEIVKKNKIKHEANKIFK